MVFCVLQNSALFKHLKELGYGDEFDAEPHGPDFHPPQDEDEKYSKGKRSHKKPKPKQVQSIT